MDGPDQGPAEEVAAPEAAPSDAGPETEADDVQTARAEADQYREHLQRLQAEFDNYRKRVLREQTSAVELAAQPVLRRLLEVLDDFDLALMHAEDRPDFEPLRAQLVDDFDWIATGEPEIAERVGAHRLLELRRDVRGRRVALQRRGLLWQ